MVDGTVGVPQGPGVVEVGAPPGVDLVSGVHGLPTVVTTSEGTVFRLLGTGYRKDLEIKVERERETHTHTRKHFIPNLIQN